MGPVLRVFQRPARRGVHQAGTPPSHRRRTVRVEPQLDAADRGFLLIGRRDLDTPAGRRPTAALKPVTKQLLQVHVVRRTTEQHALRNPVLAVRPATDGPSVSRPVFDRRTPGRSHPRLRHDASRTPVRILGKNGSADRAGRDLSLFSASWCCFARRRGPAGVVGVRPHRAEARRRSRGDVTGARPGPLEAARRCCGFLDVAPAVPLATARGRSLIGPSPACSFRASCSLNEQKNHRFRW